MFVSSVIVTLKVVKLSAQCGVPESESSCSLDNLSQYYTIHNITQHTKLPPSLSLSLSLNLAICHFLSLFSIPLSRSFIYLSHTKRLRVFGLCFTFLGLSLSIFLSLALFEYTCISLSPSLPLSPPKHNHIDSPSHSLTLSLSLSLSYSLSFPPPSTLSTA